MSRTNRLVLLVSVHYVLNLAEIEGRDHMYATSSNQSSTECTVDQDCLQGFICNTEFNSCEEQNILLFSQVNMIGTIGAFVAVSLSAGGGLGGGGLMVPLFMLVLNFGAHYAIPLSKATIFGSAIASAIVNVPKKHPLVKKRLLIDFETLFMMEPMTLAGTIIGVHLNTIFPEWLITLLLVILLTKTSIRTFKKGQKIWKKECALDHAVAAEVVRFWKLLLVFRESPELEGPWHVIQKWKQYKRDHVLRIYTDDITSTELEEKESDLEMVQLQPLASNGQEFHDDEVVHPVEEEENDCLVVDSSSSVTRKSSKESLDGSDGETPTLDDFSHYKTSIPYSDLTVLLMIWCGLFLFTLLKGGHGTPSIAGIECGSTTYALLTAFSFVFFIMSTAYFGRKIVHQHTLMRNTGFEYVSGDVVWTTAAALRYPALCMFAGIAAGLLGIGGGMVKGPLLLEMGVLPQVAAATSALMILFTSSATTIQYIVLGTLPLDFALWYGVVGCCGGFVGQIGVAYVIRKYRKTALVIFLIAIMIGLSGSVMGTAGILGMIEHGVGEFHSICHR